MITNGMALRSLDDKQMSKVMASDRYMELDLSLLIDMEHDFDKAVEVYENWLKQPADKELFESVLDKATIKKIWG